MGAIKLNKINLFGQEYVLSNGSGSGGGSDRNHQ